MRTPSGGLHAYFRGSDQRNGHLPAHHLDFRSRGGYVLAPPSLVDGKPYQLIRTVEADGGLDWATVTALLEPQRQIARPQPRPAPDRDLSHLARWVASQAEGNRNAGLFWAANRALEADPAADLSPLAAAARQAGLDDKEITRTLDSARRTGQPATSRPITKPSRAADMSHHDPRPGRPDPRRSQPARLQPRPGPRPPAARKTAAPTAASPPRPAWPRPPSATWLSGRRPATPYTTTAVLAVTTAGPAPRPRWTPAAPGCGCAPCT